MAEQVKKTKVNIALVFLLSVSLDLTSLPCTPHFSWILPAYSHSRDPRFSSHPHGCCWGGCSPLTWSCLGFGVLLGIFLVWLGFRLHSLAGICSFPHFLPLDHSDGTACSPLEWRPKWAREEEPAFLWSVPSFVTAPRGKFSATATQQSYLDTRVRFFFFPSPWSLGLSLA